MTLGVSLFLFAVGAILAWAVNIDTEAIDLDVVGYVLMGVGILGFIVSLFLWTSRRRTVHGATTTHDHYDEPPPV
jgi:Domain of unknown function (DUF6458)